MGLKVGDRKVLPRMPMFARHESMGKKILLSPLRVTGATLRGASYLTMELGRGIYWIGDKASLRRTKGDRFVPESEYLEERRKKEEKAKKQAAKRAKKNVKRNKAGVDCKPPTDQEKTTYSTESDFKVFNEKGEKTWRESADGDDGFSTTTAAASLLDEKAEKEFC